MSWEIEYTNEFDIWWQTLREEQQDDIVSVVQLLEEKGTQLPFPYSSDVKGAKNSHLRELRIQSRGKPIRVFYAFDPRRVAILRIGGDKRFYEKYVPIADRLYEEYLQEISQEGLI